MTFFTAGKSQMLNNLRITPRWVIFLLDLFFSAFGVTIAHMVRQSVTQDPLGTSFLLRELVFILVVNTIIFYFFKVHTGIVRYSGPRDTGRIVIAISISMVLLLIGNEAGLVQASGEDYSRGIIVVYGSFSILSLLAYRFMIKYVFHYLKRNQHLKRNVAIFGAGMAGITTKKVLDNDPNSRVVVSVFIDDNKQKINNQIESVSILSFEDFVKKREDFKNL